MNTRGPSFDPGARPVPVTLRAREWDWGPDVAPSFVLKPCKRYGEGPPTEWEAYLPDGTWIGTVGRYEGSITTKIRGTRLARHGKRRVLWKYEGPRMDRPMHQETSRADCLRALLADHRRRA